MYSQYGITFFKDGGKQFSSEMLKDTYTDVFQKMIRDGLRTYFSPNGDDMTDNELADELIAVEDINDIPLPAVELTSPRME